MRSFFCNNHTFRISNFLDILSMSFIILLIFSMLNNIFANDFNVIAKVNNGIITNYDLDKYSNIYNKFYNNKKQNYLSKEELLSNLIQERLKISAILSEQIEFNESEFEYFLNNLEINKKNINKENSTEYLEFLKNSYLWVKFINLKIKPNIRINNNEITDALEYLLNNPIKTKYNISQIIISSDSKFASKDVIHKIYEEIKLKNNFEFMADKFSINNSKNKGYIGWVYESDINENFYNLIKDLSVGEVSEPIYFGDKNSGYYLMVKLNDKKEEKILNDNDINNARAFLYNKRLDLEIKQYLDNLYSSSLIEIY